MAYKFATGFDFYTNPAQLWNTLNGGGTISTSSSRFPTVTGAVPNKGILTGHSQFIWNLPLASVATAICGFAFQTNANLIAQDCICIFFDTVGNSTQCYLGLNTSLQLQFYAGKSNSFPGLTEVAIGPPSAVALVPNTWYYIECKVTISSTVGAVECRLNGATVISATGLNTQIDANATFNSMGFGQINGLANASTHQYDDVYFIDTTGAAPLNTYLGDTRINTYMPAADSANASLNQFSTSPSQAVGSHYKNVNEVPADDGTSINFDGNPNDRESYRVAGVSGNSISLVSVWARFQKDDSNSRSVAVTATNNGVDTIGTTVTSPSSYAYTNQTFPNDPNTGLPWTVAGFGNGTLSNAEFGLKIIS